MKNEIVSVAKLACFSGRQAWSTQDAKIHPQSLSCIPLYMNASRIKFVLIFLIFTVAFIFGTVYLLAQPAESLLGAESQRGWMRAISTILSPIKIVLMGPLLALIKFLHQDPDTPPPFFLALFVFYWSILALILHFLLSKIYKRRLT